MKPVVKAANTGLVLTSGDPGSYAPVLALKYCLAVTPASESTVKGVANELQEAVVQRAFSVFSSFKSYVLDRFSTGSC